jgi:DNA-binding NarL/FixJ family response regulator
MIRVLVVDDQALIRAGLVALFHAAPGLEVVGEAADGAEAVAPRHQDQAVGLLPAERGADRAAAGRADQDAGLLTS